MRGRSVWMALLVACSMAIVLHGSDAAAQSATEFYKGNTISVLVSSDAGSGFDIEARAIAPFLEKYTGAKCIITDLSAGGGLVARIKLFEAKPDGLTIMLSDNGPKLITASLFKLEGVRYEWNKFVPLGKIIYSPSVFNVSKKMGIKSIKELVGVNFLCGTGAPFFEPLFAEALGLTGMKIVTGLGGNERVMAMRRGEIQATVSNVTTLKQNAEVMQAIAVTSRDEELFPGIPDAQEFTVKGKEKWAKYMDAADTVMFWAITAPGTPKDRAAYLEATLKKIHEDPSFLPALAKVGVIRAPKFVPSARLEEMMKAFASMSADNIKEMQQVIETKYVVKK
jgi:putative tricarboxylic transport membrane protein